MNQKTTRRDTAELRGKTLNALARLQAQVAEVALLVEGNPKLSDVGLLQAFLRAGEASVKLQNALELLRRPNRAN